MVQVALYITTSITFSTLRLDNLKSKANFLNLYITPTQPTIISCSSTIFNMYYATSTQPKIVTDKIFLLSLFQPDFFKLAENDFRGLHLHNLKSLRRYHCTLHSRNLTFATLVQFTFRVLHLHNLKSLPTISLYTTLAQPDFHYICRTWFQSFTLAQPKIFIFMVKWHISRHTGTPWFSLQS